MNDIEKSGSEGDMRKRGAQPKATLDAVTVKAGVLADASDGTVFVKYLKDPASPLVVTVDKYWELPTFPGDEDVLKLFHVQTNTQIALHRFVQGDETKFPFDIEVPKSMIEVWGEGSNTFTYTVDHYNTQFSDSLDLTLLFDRVGPYNQTAPVRMPDIAAVTDANKNGVKLELPEYDDYKPGDKVAYWWQASIPQDPWTVPYVDIVDVATLPQELPVPASIIDSVGDGGVMALYILLDKAGNNSHLSDITHIGVALGDLPINLKDPVVPQAAKGLINQQDAFDGVVVQVLEFDNWKPNDELRVIWGAQEPTNWRPVSDSGKFPMEFSIQADTLLADYGADGTGDKDTAVLYEVRRGTVAQGIKSINVDVNLERIGPVNPVDPDPEWPDPVNPRLETINITGASGEENHLQDPDDEFQDATLTLQVNASLEEDDELTFYWRDELVPGIDHTVAAGEPGTEITKTVKWDVIKAGGNGSVPVHYRVQRPGNPNPISSKNTDVLVEAVGIHPVAPTFQGLATNGWLTCSSIYENDTDRDPAVRVQMEDLTGYGLQSGDSITMHWSAVHGRVGEDPVAGVELDETIDLDSTTVKGFVWKVPFETNVKDIYDPSNNRPDGRGRVKYSFTLNGKPYESEEQETVVSMHDGKDSCPLRP